MIVFLLECKHKGNGLCFDSYQAVEFNCGEHLRSRRGWGGATFYILLCTPFMYLLLSNGTSCTYLKNFESPLTAGSALSFKSK